MKYSVIYFSMLGIKFNFPNDIDERVTLFMGLPIRAGVFLFSNVGSTGKEEKRCLILKRTKTRTGILLPR